MGFKRKSKPVAELIIEMILKHKNVCDFWVFSIELKKTWVLSLWRKFVKVFAFMVREKPGKLQP